MINRKIVFLFDVDGVLVEPLAYRLGIAKTLEVLCERAGIKDSAILLPEPKEIAYMESCGLHDVWDMTNIMFSLILLSVRQVLLKQQTSFTLVTGLVEDALAAIKKTTPCITKPDYASFTSQLTDAHGAVHMPEVALALIENALRSSNSSEDAESWCAVVREFLHGTRSPYKSYGTRLLQNIILGSSAFSATYDLPSTFDGPSLLETTDRILITEHSLRVLEELEGNLDFKAAVYTARPSLPPQGVSDYLGYSPEAEMGANAAGLQHLPLVGMGMMEWLAKQHAVLCEDLTKPNATQAAVALLVALAGRSDAAVMHSGFSLVHGANDENEWNYLRDMDLLVYVFEDTISGVKPMHAVAAILTDKGCRITLKALGIASDKNKRDALSPFCAAMFADVNEAIEFASADAAQSGGSVHLPSSTAG